MDTKRKINNKEGEKKRKENRRIGQWYELEEKKKKKRMRAN